MLIYNHKLRFFAHACLAFSALAKLCWGLHKVQQRQILMKIWVMVVFAFILLACRHAANIPAKKMNTSADMDDLTSLTVFAAAAKIQNAEITSVQLVDALIKKIASHAQLNAFISFDAERARALAQAADQRSVGRLRGVPLIVKDNIEVSGIQHTAGTPGLLGYIPAANAAVIDALVAAGAIIIGKANMHELAFGITSNNSHFGAVRNPHKPTHFAGGSSGGTAAAIAAGMVPAGLGTDTGGSARIPAALTGINGFRPTTGRYSAVGVTPISTTRDTVGIMAKSVEDIILLDSVITESKANLDAILAKSIRLGVPEDYFYDNLESGVRAVVDQALRKLEKANITLVPVSMTADLQKLNDAVGFPVVLYEAKIALNHYLLERKYVDYDDLVAAIASPDVAATFAQAVGTINADVYAYAIEVARPQLQKLYADLFSTNHIDGIIYPTTPLTARPIVGSDETIDLNLVPVNTFLTYIHNTDPSSNAGIPSISIHAGSTAGLPVGIAIDAPAGTDARLLRIARTIEQILRHEGSL